MSLKAQARKRVLILVVGALLIGGLLGSGVVVHMVRDSRRFAIYRRDGLAEAASASPTESDAIAGDDAQADAKRYADALNKLKACLRRTPDDPEVWAALVHTLEKTDLAHAHDSEIVDDIRQLLRQDPTRNEDRRALMEIYLRHSMMTEVNSTADDLLTRAPGDGEALKAKAAALMQLHKYAEALAAAELRISTAPDDWAAQLYRVQCLSNTGHKPDEIATIAAGLVKRYPDAQGAWMVQAYADALNDQFPEGAVCLRNASTRPSTDVTVTDSLVRALDSSHLHADSMVVLKGAMSLNNPFMRQVYLRRLWEDGRFFEAADLAGGPAGASLSDSESLGLYADSLRRSGKTPESAAVRATLAAKKDDKTAAAWLAIEAAQMTSGRDAALALRAACTAAAEAQPRDPYLMYFAGAADAVLGETASAIDHWNKAAALQDTWALPLIQVAQAQLAQGHREAAATAAEDAFRRAPGSVEVAIVQAMVWFSAEDSGDTSHVGDLNNLIDEIQQRAPGEEQTARMRVALLAQAGQTDKATQALREILAKQPPDSQKTLLLLAEISRKWNLGLENDCMEAVQKTYGRTPQALLTEALDDWKRTKDDTGLKLLEAAVADSSGTQRIAYRLAVTSYLELTGDSGAATAWAALGDQYPNELMVQRAALMSPTAYTDRDFYDRTIERARKLLGEDSTTWKVARARWLLDGPEDPKTTADANTLLQAVLTHEPDSLAANVLMGMAKARAGDMNGATAQIAAAQRLDPKSTMMAMDMARLLQYRGDFTGARQQLDLVIKDPKSAPSQLAQAAGMLASQGDVPTAIQVLEPVAADAKAQESFKLQLGSLYCRAKLYDKAQSIADELMKKPDPGAILLAANIQILRGQSDAADKVLEQLDKLPAKPGEVERTKGNLYYSYGQFDKALSLFKAATVAAPANPANWISLMLCQVAMGHSADLPATVADAAKGNPNNSQISELQAESSLLAGAGAGETQQQILSAAIRDPSPTGPAITTLKALVDLSTSTAPTAETLQKMQNLASDLPRFLPAQILLIETDLRLGRCTDAIQASNRALENFPTEARPAELATLSLSSYGQWGEALDAAHTWKTRMVGDTSGVDLQIAQIQMRMGNAPGAQETLAPYVRRTDLSPTFKWEVLLTEAQSMIRQGKTDDAIQLLWPTAQSTPADQPTFMGFLANNLPPAQAEPWLTQLSTALSNQPHSEDMQIALATTWNLLFERGGDKRYDQLAKDLVAKLEQNPAVSAKAALTAGIFADTSGDYTTAEAAYRRALSRGDLPEASNNLAMVLADHGGDLKEAVSLAQKCVAGAPDQATYRDTQAYIQAKNKQFDAAVGAEQAAVRMEPNNAKWRVNLSKILVAAGKFDQAKQQLAELDLMTPGVRSLSDQYKSDLDGVRKQIAVNAGGPPAR